MADFEVDFSEIDRFIRQLNNASRLEFKRKVALWFEACGFDFLEVIQNEIIRLQVVDTRLLLNSFTKGANENEWEISNGGLTLMVGTNVLYAKFVNDGHWTNPQGVNTRFVPGVFEGGKFKYKRGSETGMILKQRFVEGRHYWDKAIVIYERIFQTSLERSLQHWLDTYFK